MATDKSCNFTGDKTDDEKLKSLQYIQSNYTTVSVDKLKGGITELHLHYDDGTYDIVQYKEQ